MEGEWAGGPNPPPPSMWAADALFLCGSWASCFESQRRRAGMFNWLSHAHFINVEYFRLHILFNAPPVKVT